VMETLRDCKPSLVRVTPEREQISYAAPDREQIPYTNEKDTAEIHDSTTGKNSIEMTGVAVPTESRPPQAQIVTDRFAAGYADPLFPDKQIPYAGLKRTFDILFALTVLAIAWPIMLIVALLVKLTSRGPIIFQQVRVGQRGRYFNCYKFRSMCPDAEEKKKLLMHLNEASGPVFKIKHDPRLTPIGAFIRKTSLDELPQLFNVLKGDMSIVGPRPPIPSEVELYSPRERGRLAVRPGLTCLWQVSGRSNVSFDRWVELDLLYIETMSFRNDLKIVIKTVPAVLTGSGAH
jgi:exopolysaccharide biosynthesis polyprenyl glycosylphosphotransferase